MEKFSFFNQFNILIHTFYIYMFIICPWLSCCSLWWSWSFVSFPSGPFWASQASILTLSPQTSPQMKTWVFCLLLLKWTRMTILFHILETCIVEATIYCKEDSIYASVKKKWAISSFRKIVHDSLLLGLPLKVLLCFVVQIKGSWSSKRTDEESGNPYTHNSIITNCCATLCGPMPPR